MIASGDLRSTSETVDPAWLTDVLRRSGALQSARVTDLTWKNVGAGMLGDSIRFDLRYDRDEDGAPASVVGKFPARDAVSRATGIDFGLYQTEVRFYQEIAATVAVRAPHCYYADINPATGDFAVILEDLGPARQGNQLTGCSLADAEQAMIQGAALHGPRWGEAGLRDIPWIASRAGTGSAVVDGMPGFIAEFHRRYDDILEPEFMAVADRYAANALAFLGRDYAPLTLGHVDFRLDNMLFDARGGSVPLAVLDWQSVSVTAGMLDISYFLGAGITRDERRQHERDLLGLYLEELRRYGVRDYGWDALWHDYRVTAFQGVSTAIFASAATARTERGDAMFLAMARGACAQVIDIDSFGALLG
ncbi:oxidoreductase family protein [Polymorphobacter arshaanensis]|uniref:oxidoreductase family protein n=1 Tax=Glacieibacterium arshaanense TaxID=2511025 RepID=UPI001A9C60F9|nr:oxidoreductase family protein [Polymorphobacter arshaanensis]